MSNANRRSISQETIIKTKSHKMTSGVTEQGTQIREIEPLRRTVINRRFAETVDKAVASASAAYDFNPGSYTARALSDVVTVQTMLGWLDDLGAK